jgi:beta-barrel assembly-enhancing protease
MNRFRVFAGRWAFVFSAALLMSATVASAQTKIKPGFNLFSASQDVEIGTASAAEAEKQFPLVNDRDVVAYVNEIGQRLAAKAGGPDFSYQFRVINTSDVNAFALPGGFVYINRGILEVAHNEGEVAGVMAHEIAHVALRHGTHQASKAYGAQAGLSILGGLLGGRVGDSTAGIINAIGGVGMNLLFLKFSRDLETQADVRGAQILAASGYTPADMVSFFKTLEKVDTSRKTNWLSNHPAPPDRIARIENEAQLLRVSAQPTQRIAELNGIQSRLRGLGPAPTMAQIASGQTTGSPTPAQTSSPADLPSTSLSSYTNRAGVYRISYPANWRVHEQGTTAVVFAPDSGIAQVGGRTEIVYGAIINHYEPFGNVSNRLIPGSSGDVSIEDATNDLIAQIKQTDPYLQTVRGSSKALNLRSGRALTASLRGVNPRTRINERVTVVTHQLADDHLVYMLFATPERDVNNYAGTLNAMLSSLQINEERSH